MVDRRGKVIDYAKVLYGHSFAIYCLSEYTLATGDKTGIDYAERTFELMAGVLVPKTLIPIARLLPFPQSIRVLFTIELEALSVLIAYE